MKELNINELGLVQGAGILYEIAKFFGYANQSLKQIDWASVSQQAKATQEEYNLRD